MELIIPSVRIKIPSLISLAELAVTAALASFALFVMRDSVESAGTPTNALVDAAGGQHTSLELDANGNPVVSYYVLGDLKLLHCGNANCLAGNSAMSPDTGGDVGQYTSLELDAAGLPVISYYDETNADLKVMHCNDVNCAGGGESITSPDTAGSVGSDTSLTLDAAGRPVISYFDFTNFDLKVLHCGNPNCTSGNSTTSPDTSEFAGGQSSIEMDAAGRPVISYLYGAGIGDLRVLHCGNANCTSGNSVMSPDTAGLVGAYTSLELDDSGFPVVSYQSYSANDLKVMHCNDANCAGGGESITSPHTFGDVGEYTSLALDAAGFPVVTYYDATNTDLWVMHCNDVNCAGGGETFSGVTSGLDLGQYSSVGLDTFGRPVVSFYDETNDNLQVLHCGTPSCNNAGVQEIRIASLTAGWPSGPMRGTCYNVDPVGVLPVFVVCDNNSGPSLGFSNACLKEGSLACTDDDFAVGSITLAVNVGAFDVTVEATPGHTPDPHLKFCDPTALSDAKCTFTHTPITRPWFPWDLNGDGSVSAPDIFQEIAHFNETK